MNLYQIEPIFYFFGFTIIFYLHGAFFIKKPLAKSEWVEDFFIKTILGFGFVTFTLFFIAVVHLLNIYTVSITYSIIPIVYLYQYYKNNTNTINFKKVYFGLINHAGIIFIIIALLVKAYLIFFPETKSDAMRYHLPYAKFYVQNHGLEVYEYLRYPVFSHNIDLNFSLGYLYLGDFQGEVLARMFSLFAFILILLGLYSLVCKSINKATAFFACVILVTVKEPRDFMIAGYIDIGLALFVFSCIYFIYQWQSTNDKKWLYFSAIMLGLAIGTKYLALLWLLPMAIWVFSVNKNWKNICQYFIIVLVIGSPWYIRNIIIAGNPIHPFLQDVFGYWLWTPADIVGQKEDLLDRHGVERIWSNLLQLPYLLITEKYFTYSHWGWGLSVGIPLMIISICLSRFYKSLAIFILFNLVFWFYTSQITRYLMAIIPFIAIFAAYPWGWVFNKVLQHKYLNYKPLIHTVAIIGLSYAIYTVSNIYITKNNEKPLPQSDLEWHKYNLKQNNYYQFSHILNQRKAKRVLNISDARLENTFNGLVLGDWFGSVNKSDIFTQTKSVQQLTAVLNKHKTKYLLVGKKQKHYNKLNKIIANEGGLDIVKETNSHILYNIK